MVIEDVPTPRPARGEVVVKVDGAGFCHSDLHVLDGELRILPRLPVTLGHENAGFVADVGAGVTTVKEGDPVAVFGGWGDGLCAHCVAGEEQLCENPTWAGLSVHDGGYAEYLRVPHERYLVPLRRLAPREAAPLTDAALTPYRAVRLALPYLEPDHFALVVGLGGLGEYGLRLLRVLAGSPVIVVEVSEAKRRRAKALGAAEVLDGKAPDVAERIREITGGHGVCAAFDFVGADATLALCVGATRARGKVSHIGLAGGSASLRPLASSRFEVAYEATLWGTIKELREVVALAESGRLERIPAEYAALESINDVAARLKRGDVEGRIVITPSG